ncbi:MULTISPECIES: ATP-binding protein [Methylomicrobium]|jgi:serine/threonine-protein kinase RsbW|uniref:Anti-sigma regulatory factor (Ser/Thr protein kinase) n=1 Tax=Methylomicrobium album BG8 TaxID=686340 RepID=H8GHI6_METAL|nr:MULTISPECIES: ATP-binding protein [Methylomicrobium]EIC30138.1 anti-sigma regulatory factor (Ser/Thr protein kinase) [Methylomicrobium album BG8]MBL1265529.1 ATP-binding protein [Methylomicrobium sp. RS1]
MCDPIMQVEVIIPTQTKYLNLIGSIGEHIAKELEDYSGDREMLAYHLNLVLTEATANAIKHANCNDPKDSVRITIHIDDHELKIKVYDHGQGFDLEKVDIPDFDHPKEGGMGVYFIRTLMDSVTYNRMSDCNVLEIVKHLK